MRVKKPLKNKERKMREGAQRVNITIVVLLFCFCIRNIKLIPNVISAFFSHWNWFSGGIYHYGRKQNWNREWGWKGLVKWSCASYTEENTTCTICLWVQMKIWCFLLFPQQHLFTNLLLHYRRQISFTQYETILLQQHVWLTRMMKENSKRIRRKTQKHRKSSQKLWKTIMIMLH